MPSRIRDEDIELLDDEPPSIEPYEVLGLSKDATQEQIKSAYRKAALKNHPDKVVSIDKEEANHKFQEIAFAYAILSDEKRRRRYDTTGRTEESLNDDEDFNWLDFYREQFKSFVTTEKIQNFSKQYKGSDEEKEHLLEAYEKYEGRMDRIYSSVMLSDVLEDDERFRAIIDAAIESGEVQSFKNYIEEPEKTKRNRIVNAQKNRERHEKEAQKKAENGESSGVKGATQAKKSKGDAGDLAALIQQRQKQRAGDFFDHLEAKYAPKNQKAGSKRSLDEPPEEAFAKNAKKGKTKAK